MVLRAGAEWLFKAQPQNRRQSNTQVNAAAGNGDSASSSSTSAPKGSKRKWRPPTPAGELNAEYLSRSAKRMCCKLRCIEKFASREFNIDLLKLAQDRVEKLTTEPERKGFVEECAPLVRPERGSMYAAGNLVCNEAFCGLFGVSKDLINAAKGTPGARASSSIHSETTLRAAPQSRKRGLVLAFLRDYADSAGQKMPHNDRIHLYGASKKEIYHYYCEHIHHMFRDADSELKGALASADYFNTVWRTEFPSLKMKAGGDFMKCTLCTTLKEHIHGAPGQRADCNGADAAQLKEKYDAHLKAVRADRDIIAVYETRARQAKADNRPHEFIYLSADAADNNKLSLPHEATLTHGGERGYSEKQKTYGVLVEGHHMNVFFTPQILGTGSNLVCTVLFLVLEQLFLEFGQELVRELVIQVDNTVAEAKNNYLVGFLGLLVARGVVQTATLVMMPVGHTHIKIDQVFGRFAQAVKGHNIFSRNHLASALSNAINTMDVHTTTLENLANVKGLLTGNVRRIHQISAYRGFRVSREGCAIVVEVKNNMHDQAWLGFSANGKDVGIGEGFSPHRLFYASTLRLEGIPAYELKVVDPRTIGLIQQRYETSRARLPAAFPGDLPRQEAIKAEQSAQVELLKRTGTVPCGLNFDWLPDTAGGGGSEGESSSSGEEEDDDDNNGSGEEHFSSDEEDEPSAKTAQGPPPPRRQTAQERGAVGTFAFFLATKAPFLVGKVDEERSGEVRVLWYTPKESLVEQAEWIGLETYAKAVFRQTYTVAEDGPSGRQKKKKRLVPDTSWEPVGRVAASCPKLRKGKYIPAKVVKDIRNLTES